MNNLISVVVPLYNQEKYIRECINSILNQTYENFEIIIIDDGSTDNSGKIVDEIARTNMNIKVIHKINEGLGFARNDGIINANGDYVTFIDSDDFISCDYLERLIDLARINNADTVYSGHFKYHSKKRIDVVKKTIQEELFDKSIIISNLIPRLFGSLPHVKDTIPMSATMSLFSMKIIKDYCIRFPSEREILCEDVIFNIDYLVHTNKVLLSNYVGYFYRDNANSLTTSYNVNNFKLIIKLYELEKNKMKDIYYNWNVELRLRWQFFINITGVIKKIINKYGVFTLKCYKEVKYIINDSFVNKITNDYPIKNTLFPQSLFVYSLKYKLTFLLILMCNLKK